jgi:hypothetical protein
LVFFFTILSFGQLYKRYISSKCIYQNFTIRKLISTRYDLSDEEFSKKYEAFNPQINLINQHFTYEPNTYTYINDIYKKPPPTQMEIEGAKRFEMYIPKYEIYSKEEDIERAGTIKDTPGYANFNDKQNTELNNISNGNYIKDIPLSSIKIDYQREFINEKPDTQINTNSNENQNNEAYSGNIQENIESNNYHNKNIYNDNK